MFLDYQHIIDLIFPPSDDERMLRDCTDTDFLHAQQIQKERQIISLARFTEPKIKAAIHLNKFHNHPHAQELLALLLTTWITSLQDQEYIVIPVPLSTQRQRERGYNQVTEVCINACKNVQNCSVATNILIRTKHTKPQTSLQAAQRRSNLKNAFSIQNENMIVGKNVILVDDVYTTGTTLAECSKALGKVQTNSLTTVAFAH